MGYLISKYLNSKIIKIVIFSILLGGIVYGGYWYWQKSNQVVDETANWETYRNEEYGFEFKYPSSWQLYDAIQNPTWFENSYKIRVNYRKNGTVSSPTYCQARPTDQRCQKTQVEGGQAIIDWGGPEGNDVSIDISDKDRGLIDIYIMNYASAEKSTIDQILSTFKFIDETPISKPNRTSYKKDGTCPEGYVDYGIPLQCVTPEYMEYCRTNACPICLAESTLIDTPYGPIPVQDLQIGTPIWTVNRLGQRVPGIVLKIGITPAPPDHQVVHLILNDSRELFVSPGHSTIDGRTVGDLVAGDLYDGVSVVSTELVAYGKSATYDILPSGDTGFYWANSILIGSTLNESR